MKTETTPRLLASRKGFALVIVIVVMLLSTFLASQLVLQVRTELKVAHNAKMRAAGLFLAESGIHLGIFRLLDKPTNNEDEEYNVFLQGHTYNATLEDGQVQYYAVNESGKIDLNYIPRRLFELFLEYHAVEPEQIQTIIDSIQDWRDADDFHRLNGAEKETYEELEPPYAPRNGQIEDPAEFFLINGTSVLTHRFAADEIFTVFNKTNKINFNSLTPAMLDFLTEGDPEKKEAYVQAQTLYNNLNAATAREILGDERYNILRPYLTYASGRNPYYFIVSVGRKGYAPVDEEQDEEQRQRHFPGTKVSVLLNLQHRNFTYLSWKESHI